MQLQRRGVLPAPRGRPRSCSRLLQRCIRRYATSECCHHGDSTYTFGCEHGSTNSWVSPLRMACVCTLLMTRTSWGSS